MVIFVPHILLIVHLIIDCITIYQMEKEVLSFIKASKLKKNKFTIRKII